MDGKKADLNLREGSCCLFRSYRFNDGFTADSGWDHLSPKGAGEKLGTSSGVGVTILSEGCNQGTLCPVIILFGKGSLDNSHSLIISMANMTACVFMGESQFIRATVLQQALH